MIDTKLSTEDIFKNSKWAVCKTELIKETEKAVYFKIINDEYDYFDDLEIWFPKSQVKFKISDDKKFYHLVVPEWLYLAKMEELKIKVE